MAWPVSNNVETLAQRALADYLRAALPDEVAVERRLIAEAAGVGRVTVLPGKSPAVATVQYLGGVRATRDEEFTVIAVCEAVNDDQDELEDHMQEMATVVEDTAADNPTLGDLDGVTMFGVTVERTTGPVTELDPGVLYQWIEIEVSVRARYD